MLPDYGRALGYIVRMLLVVSDTTQEVTKHSLVHISLTHREMVVICISFQCLYLTRKSDLDCDLPVPQVRGVRSMCITPLPTRETVCERVVQPYEVRNVRLLFRNRIDCKFN